VHLALDVHYGGERPRGACVAFESGEDDRPTFVIVEVFTDPAEPYEPGSFRKRELPYLTRLVESARERSSDLGTVLIDGYVWLGPGRPGLGHHLFEALGGGSPVIGVAKTRFKEAPSVEVLRGGSRSPLFITADGLAASDAAGFVRSMHGTHRIPTLLKWADRASRGDAGGQAGGR
jgi:deoxyribonuclease V